MIFDNFFLKFSQRRRAVPLWPIWTITVAAKLDQSRVLVTKFRQNRSTLKGKSAGQRQTDTQIDRQAGWFLLPDCAPVPNAASSRICDQNPRNDVDATFLDPHISVVDCRCTAPRRQYTAATHYDRQEVAVSFVRIESNFFLQYTGGTDEFEFCDF